MGTGGACTTSRAAASSASSGSGSGSGGGGAGGGAGAGGGSSSGGDGGDAGSGSASSKPPRVKKQEWFVHRHYICNGPRACPYFAQQIRGSSNLHRDAKEVQFSQGCELVGCYYDTDKGVTDTRVVCRVELRSLYQSSRLQCLTWCWSTCTMTRCVDGSCQQMTTLLLSSLSPECCEWTICR